MNQRAKATRGPGVFGAVRSIQRRATVGGAAPATPYTASATAAIPYRAVHRFFVKQS